MPLAEAVTIEVGAAIAKSILKLWLKDSDLGKDITSSLIDLFKTKTSDKLAQRRGERQFETIGEKVGESLLPLFQSEGAGLTENGRTAVAMAVAEAFNTSKLSSELLAERNLQPTQLEQHVLATADPNATRDFSEAEEALYKRIIKECCGYIVDIASQLPSFTERTFAEVLKRENQIIDKTNEILAELRQMRKNLDPMVEAERFEIEYRQAVNRNLDVLQLFGADVSLPNRRHRLSVAYITLSVEQKVPVQPTAAQLSSKDTQNGIENVIVSVDRTLASSRRLLIRGPAGSGKTTLLQWVAVKAATKSFEGPLSNWNGLIPFYIRLRHYAQKDLPKPEEFIEFSAPMIANTMPRGWVHNILRSGHAIVLIDGVDEVSAAKREEVHTWLRDLVETYAKVRFIVTSRPPAIEEGWMNHEAFSDAELQPMGLADIYSFINHWHDAVREELQADHEKAELGPLAEHLKGEIKRVRTIRTLATNPLLCAMLCALNRERRRQLPVSRIELYRACCAMLLERRDKDSQVDLRDYPSLSQSQKERLLEDLAYSMIKATLSEIPTSQVDEGFARKLTNMPNVPQDVSGVAVRKLLVERSGILREPVEGQIDFPHRTFQEFFAAQAAMNARDIETLVANADNDQWREVIILAAGLAHNREECDQLVTGLIVRGDKEQEKEKRYRLHLVAVSCMETALELGLEVKEEVGKRLDQLVPPRNITDAKALAFAGELAVPHLANRQYSAAITSACIRTLALLNSEAALKVLEGYIHDVRPTVIAELFRSWDYFDKELYAQRILSQVLQKKGRIGEVRSLEGFQYFTQVTSLDLSSCTQITDLSPLANLLQLASLNLTSCVQVNDLKPLASLTRLISLDLSYCTQVSDLRPLISMTQLTLLNMTKCTQISDLTPLTHLTRLTWLNLSICTQVNDLSPLANLSSLTFLDLKGCTQISDLGPLAHLTQLTSLNLAFCTQVSEIGPLAHLTQLKSLNLASCTQISNLSPLTHLRRLTSLTMPISKQINDLTPLANLTQLTSLDVPYCTQIRDLSPLAHLTQLTSLGLSYSPVSDLTPLSTLKGLISLKLSACQQVNDLSPLASLTQLTSLDLSHCTQVNDLGPLANLTQLTSLDLTGCGITDLSPLKRLSKLRVIGKISHYH